MGFDAGQLGAVEVHILRGHVGEEPGPVLLDEPFHLLGGLDDGVAGGVGGGGGIGAAVEGGHIGVGGIDDDAVQGNPQGFGRNLGQDGVAAGADVRGPQQQAEIAVLVELQGGAGHIDVGEAGALLGDRHAQAPDNAALGAFFRLIGAPFVLPAAHDAAPLHAVFQQAAVHGDGVRAGALGQLIVEGRGLSLADHVDFPDADRIHAQLRRQLVDGAFHREGALGDAEAPERPAGHVVGIDHPAGEAAGLGFVVQGQHLAPGGAEGGGAVLAVGAGVREPLDLDGPDAAVPAGPQGDIQPHGMAGVGALEDLLAAVDDHGGPAGHQGHQGRIKLGVEGLLGSEAAADTGLDDPDAAHGQLQGGGQGPAHMEGHLGGGHHGQTVIGIQVGEGPLGLHHGLGLGLGAVGLPEDDVAVLQHGLHIPVAPVRGGHGVLQPVVAHGELGIGGLLRVHQHRGIGGLFKVQHRLQHLVIHLQKAQGLLCGGFGLCGHNGGGVPHMAHVFIQNEGVPGGKLRPALTGPGIGNPGHLLPGEHQHHPRHFFGGVGSDAADPGKGMGAGQDFDHQGVGGRQILRVLPLAGDQGHAVYFAHGLFNGFHGLSPRNSV